MNKYSILILSIILLFSCNTKQENKTSDKATAQDTLAPLRVIVIADLNDSLQPKIIYLDKMPKSLTVPAPNMARDPYSKTNSEGEGTTNSLQPPASKQLAVLQNPNGEPILDADGNPFILGDGGNPNLTNFTTDNGLALDAICCSVMDNTGNLWFGTDGGGVSKYDGKSFTSFTTAQGLASNIVFSITEDKNGNLWFGTLGGGVSKYDGRSFTSLTTAQGLANNTVWSIKEDKTGNLWFGTDGGVSKYDGRSFTSFTTAQGLANNTVRSITEDNNGNLWFGTKGGGVSKYDGKSFTSFTTAQGLANNSVFSIIKDNIGNLWFGTWGGGVSKYDGRSFTSFTTGQKNTVRIITEDKTGNLWFGTNGGGVIKYDGRYLTSFTTAQGLTQNTVRSITEDKTGNLWFGTQGFGVSKYDGRSFTSFTTAQGLAANAVFSITEDNTGNLWFGTDGFGVSKYDGRSFASFTTGQEPANITVRCIVEDKTGNLWFGTWGGGVIKYDGRSFTSFTTAQGLAHNTVRSITEDKTGNLWFGTQSGGVSRYDGRSFTSFTTAHGLANNTVWSITEDKTGNLWFGTDGGVSRYDGRSFTSYTTAQGLAANTVFSIAEDKNGNLWFGTSEGLSILDAEIIKETSPAYADASAGMAENLVLSGVKGNHNPNGYRDKGKISEELFKSFKIEDGLPDNFVTQVIQMPNGKIAVGTNLGITLFNLSEDFTKLKDLEIFNCNTGYPVKDVNSGQNCLLLDSRGIVWVGTGSEKTALVRFDYEALHRSTEPPTLVIQSIKVKDEAICWHNLQTKGVRKNHEDSAAALLQEFFAYGKTLSETQNDSIQERFGNIAFDDISKFYPLPQNLVLPYEHNQIAFEFVAIETDRPFLVRYQYILEGYDDNWSLVTDKSYANFGNMDEGTYTFKLKAQGANGVWCEPISYSFKVLPPWFRTWWAYLIYAILFLLALQMFSKWRERHLRAEKERLERTVVERTAVVEKQKEELVHKNKIVEEQMAVVEGQKAVVEKEKKRSDDLLLNILPEEVAEELKAKGSAEAKQFDEVTVLFSDFKDFTRLSENMTPTELVEEIHTCFKAFDDIMEKHGVEKIKTIGDSYMCAGGLPVANKSHASDVINAGLEIQQFILNRVAERTALGKEPFQIRIGIHTGPVVAGIVGIKKFAYDIWGDTVNTASRMESSGEVGKINISGTTHELIKDKFTCTYRGKISVKGKGEIDMHYVEGRI